MANALSSFDPVGSFQTARSNALTIAGQEADAALQPQRNELASLNLQKAKQGLQAGQLSSDQQRAATASRFIVNSNQALMQIPLEQRAAALQSLVPQAQQAGIDVGSLDLSKPLTDDVLNNAIQSAGTILQTLQGGTGEPAATAAQRERSSLLADLGGAVNQQTGQLVPVSEMTAAQRSAAVALDLIPPPVGSAIQTITQRGTAEDISTTEQIIAGGRKFGELTGASRAKAIDTGFENLTAIDKNIGNIDRAIEAIDAGASTGAIEGRFFPTLREATIQLEQIQSELALDVVGATTFGALSEGELKLARLVALPTGLQPQALKKHLIDKKAAQQKLRSYYEEQIAFLDDGGTVAGFVRGKRREQKEGGQDAGQSASQVLQFDAQGNLIQ